MTSKLQLTEIQRLPTSGARAVEVFSIQGIRYLAIPQLATDVPEQAAAMTAGNSDTDMPIYRWESGQFVEHQRLPVPGGEDAEYFTIGDRSFLATASLRSGQGPYDMAPLSVLYEFRDGRFEPFQEFATTAAKQWHYFGFDGRHFLALAQGAAGHGVEVTHASRSRIYEWDGRRFAPLQDVASAWGYNWQFFQVGDRKLLAYADHIEPSQILQWNGTGFETVQLLTGSSGRAFSHFQADGEDWLAFACLLGETWLLRWNGSVFERHQLLCGPGGREFLWIADGDAGYMVLVNFIQGSREAPIPRLQSQLLRWHGHKLNPVLEFATSGGTDAAVFTEGEQHYLAVSNSIDTSLRFRTDTCIYRLVLSSSIDPSSH